jgi:hypothetical protein
VLAAIEEDCKALKNDISFEQGSKKCIETQLSDKEIEALAIKIRIRSEKLNYYKVLKSACSEYMKKRKLFREHFISTDTMSSSSSEKDPSDPISGPMEIETHESHLSASA